MFRDHTSEWKSVSRGRARNSACNLTVFEGKYHCKYMNNNAFAQVRRPFFSVSPPNKNTPMRTCIGVHPQSSTRIRSGGGRRWRACIKRWNVATLSPRRRGDTARPISTQPEESAGRLPGWIKIPSRPGTCIRRGSRAPQAADHRRGERAKRGETTSRRSGYSPAGMAGCAPEAGGSSVAMGDCPLSAGKNSTPSVPPGRWAVRRKRINVDIWKKFDVVNEKRAPPAAHVVN